MGDERVAEDRAQLKLYTTTHKEERLKDLSSLHMLTAYISPSFFDPLLLV